MKKNLLFITLLMLFVNAFSQKTNFSRWSVTAEFGPCIFDGDVPQARMQLFPTSFEEVSFGGTVEYALTPVWGLALDYYHFPLSGRGNDIYFFTPLNTTNILATINFTKWIFPYSTSKLSIIGNIGLGYAYYVSNYKAPSPDTSPMVSIPGEAITLPVTFSMEYNFSKSFAVGGKIHYRANNKDNLEGDPRYNFKGVTNDYIGAGTLYLRYKIGAEKAQHIRNLNMDEFLPMVTKKTENQCCDKVSRMDSLLQKYETHFKKQDATIDSLKMLLVDKGPDMDGDGVPDVRDKDNSTPPNTPVDFWGRAIKISDPRVTSETKKTDIPVKNVPVVSIDDIPSVYFDFDRTYLDNTAIQTILKVGAKMLEDPTLMVEVRGYCDVMGNIKYNHKLSQKRAERVKHELVKVWGIASDRIIANGKGRILRPDTKYRPNRRCDFYFNK